MPICVKKELLSVFTLFIVYDEKYCVDPTMSEIHIKFKLKEILDM